MRVKDLGSRGEVLKFRRAGEGHNFGRAKWGEVSIRARCLLVYHNKAWRDWQYQYITRHCKDNATWENVHTVEVWKLFGHFYIIK